MNLSVAYLAQGKLYLKSERAAVQVFESQFGQSVQERRLQSQRRNAWKNKGMMERLLPPEIAEQMQNLEEPQVHVAIASLCQGEGGQLLYALEAGDVGGIFTLEPEQNQEKRLFHSADFQVGYLSFDPARSSIACTTKHRNGVSNIAVMPLNGSRPHEVTEGDSIDLAPRWVPGKTKALVFQSAGIGRDRQGFACDRAPFTIEKLDFDRQEVTCLAAEPKYDFLGPQMTADGTLYYIRRPYRPYQQSFNPLRVVKDILLMPLRLAYAIFQWLNFFTRRYTGKPLMVAGTQKPVDARQMKAWGELISPIVERSRQKTEPESIVWVPRAWQLVKQTPDGSLKAIAESVLSYDIAPNGTIVYTNGGAIYRIYPDGRTEKLLTGNCIESVAIIC